MACKPPLSKVFDFSQDKIIIFLKNVEYMRLLHYTILHKKIYLQVIYHTGRVVDPFINPEQLFLFHFSGREKKVTQKKTQKVANRVLL